MRYRQLGTTGARISEVVLGTATFGELTTPEDVDALVDLAVDAGVCAIDTGDIYAQGRSEQAVGRAVKRHARRLLVCTKVGDRVGDDPAQLQRASDGLITDAERWREGVSPNDHGLSRVHIRDAVHASLRRLDVEHIDLYQVHRWDPRTPLEETVRALDDLVRAGTVRYLGCSNYAGWQLALALGAADRLGAERFATMQLPYNLPLRERAETEQIPACRATGVGVLAYQPLAAGMLTGRYAGRRAPEPGSRYAAREGYRRRYWNDSVFEAVDRLCAAAAESGRTAGELALGWVLSRDDVTATIIGAERPQELAATLAAVERPLSAGEVESVEKAMDGDDAR